MVMLHTPLCVYTWRVRVCDVNSVDKGTRLCFGDIDVGWILVFVLWPVYYGLVWSQMPIIVLMHETQ